MLPVYDVSITKKNIWTDKRERLFIIIFLNPSL